MHHTFKLRAQSAPTLRLVAVCADLPKLCQPPTTSGLSSGLIPPAEPQSCCTCLSAHCCCCCCDVPVPGCFCRKPYPCKPRERQEGAFGGESPTLIYVLSHQREKNDPKNQQIFIHKAVKTTQTSTLFDSFSREPNCKSLCPPTYHPWTRVVSDPDG